MMSLKDQIKWCGILCACLFLLTVAYMSTIYAFYDLRVDRVLGYLKYTAGLSTLIFGLLYIFKPGDSNGETFKGRVTWYSLIGACMFLVISTYMQMTFA